MGKLARWHWLWCAWLLWNIGYSYDVKDGKVVNERRTFEMQSAYPDYEACARHAESTAKAWLSFEGPNIKDKSVTGGGGEWLYTVLYKDGGGGNSHYKCFPDSVKAGDMATRVLK